VNRIEPSKPPAVPTVLNAVRAVVESMSLRSNESPKASPLPIVRLSTAV
jgi:hypothetical protein